MLLVTEESGELALRKTSLPNGSIPSGAALISSETAQLLKKGEGSLGTAVESRTVKDSQLHDTLTLDSNTTNDRKFNNFVEVSYNKQDTVDKVIDIQTVTDKLDISQTTNNEINHTTVGTKNENNLTAIIDSDENVNTTNFNSSVTNLKNFSIETCNLNENSKNSIEVSAQDKAEDNEIADVSVDTIAISNGLELGKGNASEQNQSEAVEECSESSETEVTDDAKHVSSDLSEKLEEQPRSMAVGTDDDHLDHVEVHREVVDIEISLSDELDVIDILSDLLDCVCLENKPNNDNISVIHAQDSSVDTEQMYVEDGKIQTAEKESYYDVTLKPVQKNETDLTALNSCDSTDQDICVHTETTAAGERGHSRYFSTQEPSHAYITASDSDESDDEAFEDAQTDLPDVIGISDESLKPMDDMQSNVISINSDEDVHESPDDKGVILQTPPRSEEDLPKSNDETVPEVRLDNQTMEMMAGDGTGMNNDDHHEVRQDVASGVDESVQDMPGEIVLEVNSSDESSTNVNKMDMDERKDLETNDQPHKAMNEEDEREDRTGEQKEDQDEFYQNEISAAKVVEETSLQGTNIENTEEIIDSNQEINRVYDMQGNTTAKRESLTVNEGDMDEFQQHTSVEAVDNSARNTEEVVEYCTDLVANDGMTKIGVVDEDDKKSSLVDNKKTHDNIESTGGTNMNKSDLSNDDMPEEEAVHLGVVHLMSLESSPSTPSNSSFYEAEADRLLETSSMPDTGHSTSFTDTDNSSEISDHSSNNPTVDSESIIAEAQNISCQSWVDDEIMSNENLEMDREDHSLEKDVPETMVSYDEGSYVLDEQLIDVGNESSDTLKSDASVSLDVEQLKDEAENLPKESEIPQVTKIEPIAAAEESYEAEEQNSKEQGAAKADEGTRSTNTKEEQTAKAGSEILSLLDKEVEQNDIIKAGSEPSGEISDETKDPMIELTSSGAIQITPDAEIISQNDHHDAENATPDGHDSSSDEDDEENSSLIYDFDDIEDVADQEPDVTAQDISKDEASAESSGEESVKGVEVNGAVIDASIVEPDLAESSSEIPVKSEEPTSPNERIESPDELSFADSDASMMSPSGYQGSREDVRDREKGKKSFFKKLFRSKKN